MLPLAETHSFYRAAVESTLAAAQVPGRWRPRRRAEGSLRQGRIWSLVPRSDSRRYNSTERREPMRRLPALNRLHARHPALPPPVCASFAQAAAVSLSRHHSPPSVAMDLTCHRGSEKCEARWRAPDARAFDAWANSDDATRDGAYAVAIAAVEMSEGMVAWSRAETRTGADYYVAPGGVEPPDLEDVFRLEVSGIDHGGSATIDTRVREKLAQAADGNADGPALACVVGFKARKIVVARLA